MIDRIIIDGGTSKDKLVNTRTTDSLTELRTYELELLYSPSSGHVLVMRDFKEELVLFFSVTFLWHTKKFKSETSNYSLRQILEYLNIF